MNPPEIKNIHQLEWNATHDCTFIATITNNMVSELHFCEPPVDGQSCLKSTNENYLRQLADNLVEMFAYIDKERSKVGNFKIDKDTPITQ